MPFHELILNLIAKPKEKQTGCPIIFPDTLFYEKGQPKFIAYTNTKLADGDFCLAKHSENEDKKPLNAQELIRWL